VDGLTVTTHWEDIAELSQNPFLKVVGNQPCVDQGKIVTSAGIASGMAMCLHLISKLDSKDLAERTARQMEYPYKEVGRL
jgi:transcriptional regulator GlxA family with amidase domain